MKENTIAGRFRRLPGAWQDFARKKLGTDTYLIIASIIVGIISALAATLLKIFVGWMRELPDHLFKISSTSLLYFLLPPVGILLTVLFVRVFLHGKIDRGIGVIIHAIMKRSSVMKRSTTYSNIVTSGITVGLGGSAGLEAPIVVTCSAIGSNLAGWFHFGFKERTLLLACGAASSISAIFSSPIAGVVFAFEVLLIDLSVPLFIPLLISSATASIVSGLLYSGQLFYLITNHWNLDAIPFYIILGVVCGMISAYMTRVVHYVENFFAARKSTWGKAVAGGLSLGVLIFLFPPLFGEGYLTVTSLLNGDYASLASGSLYSHYSANPWFLVMLALVIVLIKAFATSLTLGAGGNGGIFAPSLFVGAVAGFAVAQAVNLFGLRELQVTNFVAVGMAGIMAGVVHAPLTAIFLIAEISGGYMLFVPLMIVSAISFLISRTFEPYSVYTKSLVLKGYIRKEDPAESLLGDFRLRNLVETDFIAVHASDKFHVLVDAFTRSKRNVFPVIGDNDAFIGVVNLDDIREQLVRPVTDDETTLYELARKGLLTLDVNLDLESAIQRVEHTDLWNIPVTENGKYIGFVSRQSLQAYYRKVIKKSATLF